MVVEISSVLVSISAFTLIVFSASTVKSVLFERSSTISLTKIVSTAATVSIYAVSGSIRIWPCASAVPFAVISPPILNVSARSLICPPMSVPSACILLLSDNATSEASRVIEPPLAPEAEIVPEFAIAPGELMLIFPALPVSKEAESSPTFEIACE